MFKKKTFDEEPKNTKFKYLYHELTSKLTFDQCFIDQLKIISKFAFLQNFLDFFY